MGPVRRAAPGGSDSPAGAASGSHMSRSVYWRFYTREGGCVLGKPSRGAMRPPLPFSPAHRCGSRAAGGAQGPVCAMKGAVWRVPEPLPAGSGGSNGVAPTPTGRESSRRSGAQSAGHNAAYGTHSAVHHGGFRSAPEPVNGTHACRLGSGAPPPQRKTRLTVTSSDILHRAQQQEARLSGRPLNTTAFHGAGSLPEPGE